MKIVYLRGKNPKILIDCGFHIGYERYYRKLSRYDGVEWLNNMKVLGKIEKGTLYSPEFPYGITPQYQVEVAKKLNLRIEMDGMTAGKDNKLYYYDGKYQKAKDLF